MLKHLLLLFLKEPIEMSENRVLFLFFLFRVSRFAIRERERERERVKRDSPESEAAESSQSASPAFSSQELPTNKQHARKVVGVGERIIGPEQALELIKLTAPYPP